MSDELQRPAIMDEATFIWSEWQRNHNPIIIDDIYPDPMPTLSPEQRAQFEAWFDKQKAEGKVHMWTIVTPD